MRTYKTAAVDTPTTKNTAKQISAIMTGKCTDQNSLFFFFLTEPEYIEEQFEKHSTAIQLEQLYSHSRSDFKVHSVFWYISTGQPLLQGKQM
uniref:Uncharacterized protein n=1 Tax=Rhizophora mucronata TaxID=61149 RepID=A0A2P2NJN7_RHIMU